MPTIALINPKFEPSYWGLEHSMSIFNKKASQPVSSLPLIAACTPDEFEVAIYDENIAPLDYDKIQQADIVGLTGMVVQRHRMLEIVQELKQRGCFVVIGGPWITVKEEYFDEWVDVKFIGEAEETWPQFLEEWKTQSHQFRYEQAAKTDMTKVPVPRYDLLDMKKYMFGNVQFSRGCPFQCEFCDIIVTFGRRPRLKLADQVIKEVEALYAQGMKVIFIVDDNIIGNKHGIKPILQAIADWQKEREYPIIFSTEASLNLAEDKELLRLFNEANIQSVFIGLETPNMASLKETKKVQNTREGSMSDRVRKIQKHGIDVWCGMILGFDNDQSNIFELQKDFIQDNNILHAMIGMLYAIPKTPLYQRLEKTNRLDHADVSNYGTNIIPQNLSRQELKDGYIDVMQYLYDIEPYFKRLNGLILDPEFRIAPKGDYWKKHKIGWLKTRVVLSFGAAYIFYKLMREVKDPVLRSAYKKNIAYVLKTKPDLDLIFPYLVKIGFHYHHYTMAQGMKKTEAAVTNSF